MAFGGVENGLSPISSSMTSLPAAISRLATASTLNAVSTPTEDAKLLNEGMGDDLIASSAQPPATGWGLSGNWKLGAAHARRSLTADKLKQVLRRQGTRNLVSAMLKCCLFSLWMMAQFNPSNTGELRVTVNDATGLPVQSSVELLSLANQVRRTLQTDVRGQVVVRQLPFGAYDVQVTREGFAPFSALIEIRPPPPHRWP